MARTRKIEYKVLNPTLALASGLLREEWDRKGLSLKEMAAEINELIDDDVMNAHSLSRLLWAGTDINNGLKRVTAFNRILFLVADYFGISKVEIKNKMNAEAIRLRVVADLGFAGVTQASFVTAISSKPGIKKPQMKIIKDWLGQKEVSKEFYRLIPDIASSLNFLTGSKYTPEDLKELI